MAYDKADQMVVLFGGQGLAGYLNDGLPDLRARVRWTFVAQGPLSNEASEAVHAQDPVLAEELGRRYRSAARRR